MNNQRRDKAGTEFSRSRPLKMRHGKHVAQYAARSKSGNAVNIIILLVFGAFMALPLVYTINSAFKPAHELFIFPPRIFVQNPTFDNFLDVALLMRDSWVPFSRYVFNTLFITATAIMGQIVISSLAAYVLEKRDFPGRQFIFSMVVTALMFSGTVTAIPSYITMTKIGWIDSLASIIVPAFAAPLGLFLMKQFMENLPNALMEAARIDGCSELQIFLRIVMPNVKPAWLTLMMFSFQSIWATTGGVYIYSENKKTVTYAMNQILAGGVARTGAAAAVSVCMLIVPLIIFIISQRNIIETMSPSGIKE